jgi:hypothetical protein
MSSLPRRGGLVVRGQADQLKRPPVLPGVAPLPRPTSPAVFRPAAQGGESVRSLQPLPATRPAEPPEFGRGALVPLNQVVQFELVDFSGIELGEAVTYVLEEPAQFIPVIATDELACGAPPPLSVGPRSLVFGSTTVRTYAANSRSPGISAPIVCALARGCGAAAGKRHL